MRLRSEGVWGYVDGSNNEHPTLASAMSAIIQALEATDLAALDCIKLEIEAERLTELYKSQKDEWEKRKFLAADILFSAMDLHIQTLFETEKTDPKQLWDAAQKQFAERGFTYLYDLVMALTTLRLADSHDLEDYCMKFKTLQHQLAAQQSEPPAEWYNSLFIGGLGSKFDIWQSRRRTNPTTTTTELETLMAEVREEARALESPTALLLRSKNAQLRVKHQTKPGNSTKQQSDDEQPQEPPTCNYCHKIGHVEASCWVKYPDQSPSWWQQKGKKKEEKKEEDKGEREISVAATTSDDIDFCAVAGISHDADNLLANEWVVDSGSTRHMARVKEWFSDYTPLAGQRMRQGEGFLAVEGVGDIPMQWRCRDGTEKRVTLKGVYYVPSLFTNVLSTSKVQQNGGYFDGFTDTFRRIDTGLEYGSASMRKGYWLLNCHLNLPTVALVASQLRYDGPLPSSVQEEHGHGQQRPGNCAVPRCENSSPPAVKEEQENSRQHSAGPATSQKRDRRVLTSPRSGLHRPSRPLNSLVGAAAKHKATSEILLRTPGLQNGNHCIRPYRIPQRRGSQQQFAMPKVYRSRSKSWPEETTRER
jgi:hypothetical protein